jgi:predicted nucleotidyltransferase
MLNIEKWINQFSKELDSNFGNRVWFVGLQGSYGRREATEASDIDMVVILDEVTALDISLYNTMLDSLPYRKLICGFLSGKEEILNREPSDLFQFYYDTKPIKGSLDDLLPLIDENAVTKAIKTGVCNIYHGCVHNMLYDKNEDILKGLYKSASFVIQAIYFRKMGKYITHQKELSQSVDSEEKTIVDTFIALKCGEKVDFKEMSDQLFEWSKKWINK